MIILHLNGCWSEKLFLQSFRKTKYFISHIIAANYDYFWSHNTKWKLWWFSHLMCISWAKLADQSSGHEWWECWQASTDRAGANSWPVVHYLTFRRTRLAVKWYTFMRNSTNTTYRLHAQAPHTQLQIYYNNTFIKYIAIIIISTNDDTMYIHLSWIQLNWIMPIAILYIMSHSEGTLHTTCSNSMHCKTSHV